MASLVDFWKQYPKDAQEFTDYVRAQGIWVRFELEHWPGKGIKSEYDGLSAGKLERYYVEWVESPDQFMDTHDIKIIKALMKFQRDYLQDQKDAEIDLALKKIFHLPEPPEGYYWAEDNGCLRTPGRLSFRLWCNKLGYMESDAG